MTDTATVVKIQYIISMTFEKYYSYLEPAKISGDDYKERLMRSFELWLDSPYMNDGMFCVRWCDDGELENTTTLEKFVSLIK